MKFQTKKNKVKLEDGQIVLYLMIIVFFTKL